MGNGQEFRMTRTGSLGMDFPNGRVKERRKHMPFYLKDKDISSDLAGIRSVLIVPCRFCPAASLAVREKKPFIELFRTFLRTPSYEKYIQGLKSRIEREGIRTRVFDSKLPHHFVLCMWTSGRRKDLARQTAGYDALLVLGCEAAAETVRSCTTSHDCHVISGMDVEGIMNVIPTLKFPCNIWLEVTSVTRVHVNHAGDAGTFMKRGWAEML